MSEVKTLIKVVFFLCFLSRSKLLVRGLTFEVVL